MAPDGDLLDLERRRRGRGPGLGAVEGEAQGVGLDAAGAADPQAHDADAGESGLGRRGAHDVEDRERDREFVHQAGGVGPDGARQRVRASRRSVAPGERAAGEQLAEFLGDVVGGLPGRVGGRDEAAEEGQRLLRGLAVDLLHREAGVHEDEVAGGGLLGQQHQVGLAARAADVDDGGEAVGGDDAGGDGEAHGGDCNTVPGDGNQFGPPGKCTERCRLFQDSVRLDLGVARGRIV